MDYNTLINYFRCLTCFLFFVFSPELNTPSPELLRLQAELKRLKAARRLDQEEFQKQKQVFHNQLSQEVTEKNAQWVNLQEETSVG